MARSLSFSCTDLGFVVLRRDTRLQRHQATFSNSWDLDLLALNASELLGMFPATR